MELSLQGKVYPKITSYRGSKICGPEPELMMTNTNWFKSKQHQVTSTKASWDYLIRRFYWKSHAFESSLHCKMYCSKIHGYFLPHSIQLSLRLGSSPPLQNNLYLRLLPMNASCYWLPRCELCERQLGCLITITTKSFLVKIKVS